MTSDSDLERRLENLTQELDNFRENFRHLLPKPGEVPTLSGLDIWGGTRPLGGSAGGDHVIYVDFKQRYNLSARIERAQAAGRYDIAERLELCRHKAGIALIDVSGHRMTDALLVAMLHQAFLLGALYELDRSGHITRRLFENLNTRFYQSSGTSKFVSLIYGEISSDAKFRFLSAGQPHPSIFSSSHDRFVEVSAEHLQSFPPLGMMPSLHVVDKEITASQLGFIERYEMNEWTLMGRGDILLLHSDGITEHVGPGGSYFPDVIERKLREVKHLAAKEIHQALCDDVVEFGEPTDDLSLVVIKLT